MIFKQVPNLVTVAEMVASFTNRKVREHIGLIIVPRALEEECWNAERGRSHAQWPANSSHSNRRTYVARETEKQRQISVSRN